MPHFFTYRLPKTDSAPFSIIAFVAFSFVLYASSGANLTIMSKMCVGGCRRELPS